MPHSHTEWTVDMVNGLPDDGNRYEVIDGELFVSPAPSFVHQRAALELVLLLTPYVRRVGLDLLMAPAAVTFSPRREVQPDVLVLPRNGERLAARFEDVGALVLAVEVLSPHSERTDRFKKRALYRDERVPEYWIVDAEARVVERWKPDSDHPERLNASLVWQPVATHAALAIDVAEFFRAVHGE